MDGGASGHLKHDVECATVLIYPKPVSLFFLANVIGTAIILRAPLVTIIKESRL